jgi:uncharacterized protein YxjI
VPVLDQEAIQARQVPVLDQEAIQARQPRIVVWHKKILFWNLKVFFEMVEVELGSFTPNGY